MFCRKIFYQEGAIKLREQKGFTLIEVIVVAGIIAVLAGILVPLIFKEIDESKITRASADVRSISSALIVLKKDTGQWPITASCTPTVTLLQGGGTLPTFALPSWNTAGEGWFQDYLTMDTNGCWPGGIWKGPYMASVPADPWGNRYVINADAFLSPTTAIWIISAGPNGVVDTDVGDTVKAQDDIALRLR